MNETKYRIRYNNRTIKSVVNFARTFQNIQENSKDVCFIRALGTYPELCNDMDIVDRILTQRMHQKRGNYVRLIKLPGIIDNEDIEIYKRCYKEWIDSRKKVMNHRCLKSQEAKIAAGAALEAVLLKFRECTAGISVSMEQNFAVKLMYWLEKTCGSFCENWEFSYENKFIYSGCLKKQEYLFCYFLTQFGADVLMIQTESDKEPEQALVNLSIDIKLGEFGQDNIKEYSIQEWNLTESEGTNMKKLEETELKVIKSVCGDEFVQRYYGILKRDSEGIVKIVNTGMVSSGKSSLFNILIDSTEEEHFPTGAARTTTLADYYDYHNISFIDTPGIDVRSEDDALAFQTIMEADLIIMVHNIRTGPVNRSEAEWLEKIVAGMNDVEMCKARLIFVCTWKDTREKDEDYQLILADVKNKIFEIAGTEIPFFDVSVKKYQNGVNKGKEVLINTSGIPELKEYLENYSGEYLGKKQQINQEEMKTLIQDVKEGLSTAKCAKNNEIKRIENRIQEQYRSRRSAWNQVYGTFAAKRKQLETLKNEYTNEFGLFPL